VGRQAERLDAKEFLTRSQLPAWEEGVNVAANHPLDEAVAGDTRDGGDAHQLAVAQHGNAVADPVDLLHAVGDIHHRNAPVAQVADGVEQPVGFGIRQRTGGFVHDDERGVAGQRLAHFRHLLHCERVVFHRPAYVNRDTKVGHDPHGDVQHFRAS